jgi:carbon monoxide dehydrogenase subunit G
MATIEVSVEINAPRDKVWDIVSDIDNEPKFWKGTKEVRNISKDGNKVIREVTIAFRDQKCMQEVKLSPKEKIEVEFKKGILEGTKIVNLSSNVEKTTIKATWNIKLTGMMSMFTGIVTNHIRSGTEQALQSIKKEAER